MSSLIQQILRNTATRIMLVIYLLIIGISGFYITFGYYNSLELQENRQYDKLKSIVSSLALVMDGDAVQEMLEKHPQKDDILEINDDSTYAMYNRLLSEVAKINRLDEPIYTLTYEKSKGIFVQGIRSGKNVYFRHEYVRFPKELVQKMEVGGTLPMYSSENGIWLSAFHPVRNKAGELICVLEADVDFSKFMMMVRKDFLEAILITLIIIGALAFVLTIYARKILKNDHEQKKLLIQQKTQIETKNRDINDSIRYALNIQESLLPVPSKFLRSFTDYFILYLPKDIVSGDFYWLEESEDDVFFALGDCTGHGVPGAMVSVVCSNAMNRIMNLENFNSTGNFLDQVDRLVSERFSKGSDGMDVSLCKLDKKSLTLEFSGANNGILILSNNDLKKIPSTRQPIGRHAKKCEFEVSKIQLNKGDIVFLFSDGYADQFGGVRGKKMGVKVFRELLQELKGKTMSEIKNALETHFLEWKGSCEQVDDVSVIGVLI